jgi:hypothetical protein
MRRNIAVLLAFASLVAVELLATNSAWGQVHVRAPFVRVDVGPGGVSVRAPFTAVDVPRRRYWQEAGPYGPGPEFAEPAIPSAQQLTSLSDDRLLNLLISVGRRLRIELARFDTGERWQRYLRVPVESIADPSRASEERRDTLVATIERFGNVAADPQYAMIASLPSFRATQAILAELASRVETNRVAPGAQTSAPPAEELPPPDPTRGRAKPLLPPQRTD